MFLSSNMIHKSVSSDAGSPSCGSCWMSPTIGSRRWYTSSSNFPSILSGLEIRVARTVRSAFSFGGVSLRGVTVWAAAGQTKHIKSAIKERGGLMGVENLTSTSIKRYLMIFIADWRLGNFLLADSYRCLHSDS